MPLAHEYKPSTVSGTGPPVDGVDGSPQDMFMFALNEARPECCPSTYSTSTGCVCSNAQQRRWIQSRGNNNTLEYKNVGNGDEVGQ